METRAPSPFRRAVLWKLVRVFGPILLLLGLALAYAVRTERLRSRQVALQAARGALDVCAKAMESQLTWLTSTLLFLARDPGTTRFLREDGHDRGAIEEECLRLCRAQELVDQVRMLGPDGKERVRVDHADGTLRTTPPAQLQSKEDRYYFQRTRDLPAGEVYVSPLDLNVENGRIEEPWKPVLRVATAVRDEGGDLLGVVVLNYTGTQLLQQLRRVGSASLASTYLVDAQGSYLQGPTRETSWGTVLGLPPTFASTHGTAWRRIQKRPAGAFFDHESLYVFRTLPVLRTGPVVHSDLQLRLVTNVPNRALYANATASAGRLAAVAGLAALFSLVISWRHAQVSVSRHLQEAQLRRSEERLRRLSTSLLDAQEAERRRLSRELHDELGQIATAVTIELKRAAAADGPAEKGAGIQRAIQGTQGLLDAMRRISSDLRVQVLDDLGLRAALTSHFVQLGHRGLRVRENLDFEESQLGTRETDHVYRIVQEALTNVQRHADVDEAVVSVEAHEGTLRVLVQDRGVGFDPDEVDSRRIGLLGMRERVELLGGELTVESVPGEGTLVEARIPLRDESGGERQESLRA